MDQLESERLDKLDELEKQIGKDGYNVLRAKIMLATKASESGTVFVTVKLVFEDSVTDEQILTDLNDFIGQHCGVVIWWQDEQRTFNNGLQEIRCP